MKDFFFRVLSSTAAILNLTAVTLERFVVIVYPIYSRSVCTLGNCRRVVMVVWFLSIFLAIPVIFTKVSIETDKSEIWNPTNTLKG